MNFSDLIPVIVMVLYSVQAAAMLREGQHGFAFMWLSYAMANVGILFAQRN